MRLWIDHGGADAEEDTRKQPPFEPTCHAGQHQSARLHPHAKNDQAFAAPSIAQRTSDDLTGTPDNRINRLEDADRSDSQSERGEEQRENPQLMPSLRLFYKTGLGCCEEVSVLERGQGEDFAK